MGDVESSCARDKNPGRCFNVGVSISITTKSVGHFDFWDFLLRPRPDPPPLGRKNPHEKRTPKKKSSSRFSVNLKTPPPSKNVRSDINCECSLANLIIHRARILTVLFKLAVFICVSSTEQQIWSLQSHPLVLEDQLSRQKCYWHPWDSTMFLANTVLFIGRSRAKKLSFSWLLFWNAKRNLMLAFSFFKSPNNIRFLISRNSFVPQRS